MPTSEANQATGVAVAGPTCLGPGDHGRIVSSAEFAAAEFREPFRYERSAGRLIVMSPDSWNHIETSEPWRDRLGAYALLRPDLIRRVASQAWLRIDADTDRVADISVYLIGTDPASIVPELVPDLIFEFVSPSPADRRRDYIDKRIDYEKVGVKEYIIVDRFDRKVTILSLRGGRYSERIISADGTYDSPLLPGFAVPLATVWPR